MYTDLSKKPIYDNTRIAFSADFFSPLKRERIASKMSNALRKRVVYSDKYKTRANAGSMKLYPNFFGGHKMNTIESDAMPYNEGVNTLLMTLNAIDEMGFTTRKCKMKIRVWHDAGNMGGAQMEHLNVTRFMLNLNESNILSFWKKFDSEKVWRSSLKYVYPKNVFMTDFGPALLENAAATSLKYPVSKFFGVGFDNIKNGYVELRYVSGQNYQRRKPQIIDLINGVVENVHDALMPREYTDQEYAKMSAIFAEQRDIVESMKTYESFKAKYPLITLYVDLNGNSEVLTQRFQDMREKLFDLVVYGNIKGGMINLDTARGRMQVRESYLHNGFSISDVDFFDCKLEGDFTGCGFQSCTVFSSVLRQSHLYNTNNVKNSAMFECSFIGSGNELHGAYVDNGVDKPIEADIHRSVIRRGVVTMNSVVDGETELIDASAPPANS